MKILAQILLVLLCSTAFSQTVKQNITTTGFVEIGTGAARSPMGIGITFRGAGTGSIIMTGCRGSRNSGTALLANTRAFIASTTSAAIAAPAACTDATSPCAILNPPPCFAYQFQVTACSGCSIDIEATALSD